MRPRTFLATHCGNLWSQTKHVGPILLTESWRSTPCWVVKTSQSFNVTTRRCELDAPPGDSLKRTCFYSSTQGFEWIHEVTLLTSQTRYPIWLLMMNSEACRVDPAICILEKLGVPKRSLGELKTDSIAFPAKQKKEAIKKAI